LVTFFPETTFFRFIHFWCAFWVIQPWKSQIWQKKLGSTLAFWDMDLQKSNEKSIFGLFPYSIIRPWKICLNSKSPLFLLFYKKFRFIRICVALTVHRPPKKTISVFISQNTRKKKTKNSNKSSPATRPTILRNNDDKHTNTKIK
jgi:hypothetical protein